MKYTNETRAAGVHVTEAGPMDDRIHITTEAEVMLMSNVEPMPSIMYDGMVVHFADTRRSFIWVESDHGLMAQGFTYPEWYDDIQGQDYAGKTYNFVLNDTVARLEILYDASTEGYILLPKDKLPLQVLANMENATVVLRSLNTGYKEMEFPDSLEVVAEGIKVMFDPAPTPPERFKITIY